MRGAGIGKADFEKDCPDLFRARPFQQVIEHPLRQPAPLQFRAHAEIEDVGLADRRRHHGVGLDEAVRGFQHLAVIAGPQAVAQNAIGPGEFVGSPFDGEHFLQIGVQHGPEPADAGFPQGAHGSTGFRAGAGGSAASARRASRKSSQALRFSRGARSR